MMTTKKNENRKANSELPSSTDVAEPIKTKKQKVEPSSNENKVLGARQKTYFTEQDVITLLKSLLQFAKLRNVPLPLSNLKDFYPFLEGKLSAEFSHSQIYDKLRKLKARYLRRSRNKCAEKPILSSGHEAEVYKISKKIWDADDAQGFCSKHSLLMESLQWENSLTKIDTVKENLHLIGTAEASEMELEWMRLKSEEEKIHSKKVTFKMELMTKVFNAMEDGGIGSSSASAPM